MLDFIGAIFVATLLAAVIGTLAGLMPVRPVARIGLFAAAVVWMVAVSTTIGFGWLTPEAPGPVPTSLIPFAGTLVLLFGGGLLVPSFRTAVAALPMAALVGLNVARLGGVFFLLLEAQGRLSAPFASSAGWGDILTGALAIPLTAALLLGHAPRRSWLALWNGFGALDLLVAVTIGLFSAAGTPFRFFEDGPGIAAMTALPWAMVPSVLVPTLLFIHFTVAVKLGGAPRAAATRPMHA
ncbi:hypothetical protein KEU06_01610 [Pseudaminobacter sp. 19-2017]|uniref:Uncharacterized protein n=1 Tax=Pseudaminobacter soli (ex Zhang et al. 2022) TaxID=2831468 RepID=A0A942DYG6_9HYPH|nr:hypothetical protein [Pseudaminobacter soli]MBS3647320.1 hypothetical protein [Pseudaminobacter soli]